MTVLPALIDCRGIMAETGLKRSAAEAIMRRLTKVTIPGHRRVFVYRADVVKLMRENEAA